MIISLGYRVKSSVATKFRQLATARLTEYIIKGFTMDNERMKQIEGGNYWKELLITCSFLSLSPTNGIQILIINT
jgi:hypothetical protein